METSEECWSAEQLRLAEAQIEEQKRAWELKRIAALSGNGDDRGTLNDSLGGAPQEPDGLLTYAHEDAVTQVKRKPGRPRTKSNLSQSIASEPSPSTTPPGRKGRRRRKLAQSLSAPTDLVVKKEPNHFDGENSFDANTSSISVTPERSRRRRQRDSTSSDLNMSETVFDDGSPGAGNAKALSPRTRSRGTVNINLWTLDVKPLLPGAKTVSSPRSSSNKSKESCSPVPANEISLSNGDVSDSPVPSKKAKLVSSDLDGDPDLDVVG